MGSFLRSTNTENQMGDNMRHRRITGTHSHFYSREQMSVKRTKDIPSRIFKL